MNFGRIILSILVVSAGLGGVAGGQTQPLSAQSKRVQPSQPSTPDWAELAKQVADLRAGSLDPSVDPDSLFRISLASSDALRAQIVANMVADSAYYSRVRADPSLLPLPEAEAAFAIAQAGFLRLPEKEKSRLLNIQKGRHAKAQKDADENAARRKTLDDLEAKLGILNSFLAGEPSVEGPPRLDLLELPAHNMNDEKAVPPPTADSSMSEKIAWTRGEIDRTISRILALPPDELKRYQDIASVAAANGRSLNQAEAELDSANQQLSEAVRSSADASAEQLRLIASEQAKLVSVAAAQTRLRAQLAQMKSEPLAISDLALGWRQKVQNVEGEGQQGAEADLLYDQLVSDLRNIRTRLQTSLGRSETLSSRDIAPPVLDRALPGGTKATKALQDRQRALLASAQKLQSDYSVELWNERTSLREAMVAMNSARLALIPHLSAAKRTSILGFGREGIAQAQRETSQIILDLRYHLQGWRNFLASASDLILRPTPALVLGVLRLLVIVVLFRWWRHAGGGILQRTQAELDSRRPRTLASSLQANMIGHARNVRRPLDWLVFVLVMRWLMPEELDFAGLDLAWIVLIWSLATVLLVRLANELARSGRREDPRAELRWKSLRIIAGSLLGIGLILTLTSASVGEGAIYNWVLGLCWLIVPAIVLLLAHWWRERIVALSGATAGNSMLLSWVSRDPGGITGLIGRVLAGTALLLAGAKTIIARRMGDLALVREIFEQRSRAEAARQVAEDKASGRFHHLPPETLEVLAPHRLPAESRAGDARPGGLTLPVLAPQTITAIVGERGLGKTAALRDLAEQTVGDGRFIKLSVDQRGLAGVVEDLSAELGAKARGRSLDTVARAVANDESVKLIVVDDLQRMAVPAIGGLADLDALVELGRSCGGNCAWLIGVGGPAWSYISRARADRALFDQVVRLPRWPVDALRAMIERRTAQAGLTPDFSGLIDEGAFRFDGDLSPEDRRKRSYFDRLAEYAQGNPAIAIEYWRRSLFVDGLSGRVMVRTFATPDVARLSEMPLPAMFVLRAILQMDIATEDAILRSTDLSPDVVADALRALERLGTITRTNGAFRVTLFWWSEAVRLLERRNLIIRGAR
ncbi:MAG: hypothetical protein R3E04_09485 [Sphingobium sp.]